MWRSHLCPSVQELLKAQHSLSEYSIFPVESYVLKITYFFLCKNGLPGYYRFISRIARSIVSVFFVLIMNGL